MGQVDSTRTAIIKDVMKSMQDWYFYPSASDSINNIIQKKFDNNDYASPATLEDFTWDLTRDFIDL